MTPCSWNCVEARHVSLGPKMEVTALIISFNMKLTKKTYRISAGEVEAESRCPSSPDTSPASFSGLAASG